MSVEQPRYNPTGGQQEAETPSIGLSDFETELLDRVKRDFDRASRFRGHRQRTVADHERQYNNAQYYREWRDKKQFPLPIARQLIDQLRAQLRDKLLFGGRPCRIRGEEDSDVGDADAKQAFFDWQDGRDDIASKLGQAIIDSAVHGFAVATVDYVEKERMVWKDVEGVSTKVKVRDYVGAVVNMIDPQDLYFGPDKRNLLDPFPLMVKTMQARDYFTSRPYFRNQHLILEKGGTAVSMTKDAEFKSEIMDNPEAKSTSDQPHEYVEWHGMVDKKRLFAYENERINDPADLKPVEEVEDGELTWAIVGMVGESVIVRGQEEPLGVDGPSIVVGCLDMDGSPFRAISVMDKIFPICKAADSAAGQLIENIESNIDSAWIINKEALVNQSPIVNKRGFILESNRPPSEVAQRLDQIPQTDALMALIQMYYQMARDAASLPTITLGEGDQNAETLGESTIVEAHGKLGTNDYLRTFENTFVVPLYEMRNQINSELIDFEFAFAVVGEQAMEWRVVNPEDVRANVNFVCESSTREANRAVLTQQMLNLIKLAPDVLAAGYPVRLDKMLEIIAESGMTLTQDQIHELLPTIKAEEDTGLDINGMLAQAAFMQMGLKVDLLSGQIGGMAGGAPGGQGPNMQQPLTEADAVQGANQQNQVDITKPV